MSDTQKNFQKSNVFQIVVHLAALMFAVLGVVGVSGIMTKLETDVTQSRHVAKLVAHAGDAYFTGMAHVLATARGWQVDATTAEPMKGQLMANLFQIAQTSKMPKGVNFLWTLYGGIVLGLFILAVCAGINLYWRMRKITDSPYARSVKRWHLLGMTLVTTLVTATLVVNYYDLRTRNNAVFTKETREPLKLYMNTMAGVDEAHANGFFMANAESAKPTGDGFKSFKHVEHIFYEKEEIITFQSILFIGAIIMILVDAGMKDVFHQSEKWIAAIEEDVMGGTTSAKVNMPYVKTS